MTLKVALDTLKSVSLKSRHTTPGFNSMFTHTYAHLYRNEKSEWTKPWTVLIHFCNIIQDRLEASSKRPQNYLSTPSCVCTQPNQYSHIFFFFHEMFICNVTLTKNNDNMKRPNLLVALKERDTIITVASEESSVQADSL